MEPDRVLCYVCKKSGKRCTGCLLIAYCNAECQRKDWKYHQKSCGMKPANTFDSLISNRSFQHIVSHILLYLSGKELQSFRCTKRSWRDAIVMLWKSKASRKILDERLGSRWLVGKARTQRTVYDGAGFIEHIAADHGELLVEFKPSHNIHALDVTNNYKLKYILPENSNTWVLHKDFVLVYTENAFSCWNRHNCKQIDLGEFGKQIQIGEHGRDVQKWDNKKVERYEDKPIRMEIFRDTGYIVYQSNLIVKFLVQSPYPSYDIGELNDAENKFVFKHVETFEELLKVEKSGVYIKLCHYKSKAPNAVANNVSLLSPDIKSCGKKVSPDDISSEDSALPGCYSGHDNTQSARGYSDDNTVAYVVQHSQQLLVWHLEKKTAMYTIEGVEDLLDVYRDYSHEYIVLSRTYYHTTEEELEEVYGDGERYMSEGWMNLPHLQIWSQQKCCRTLLVPGLSIAKINPRVLAVSIIPHRGDGMKGQILLWNTKQLADRKAFPLIDLDPIKKISMDENGSILLSMLFLPDRFIWCEVVHPFLIGGRRSGQDFKVRMREMNFWYC